MIRLIAIAALVLTSTAGAQQTWIVDATGGPTGTDFRDPAIVVPLTQPGDTVIVRGGNYFAFTIDKGITVIGEGTVTISGGYRITGVAAGDRAIVRSLRATFGHPSLNIGLRVNDNLGSVHLDDVQALTDTRILNSSLVTMARCELFSSSGGFEILNSNVYLDNCEVGGGQLGNAALICDASTVHIGASTVAGEDQFLFPAVEAIHLMSGALTIGAGCTIRSGISFAPPVLPAIRTFGGTLSLDTATTLAPTSPQPIQGPVTPTFSTIPALRSADAARGGQFQIDALAPMGTPLAVFLVGSASPPLATPFGDLWGTDPLIVIDSGSVPAGGSRTITAAISPATPLGLTLSLQAVAAVSGALVLSTPAAVVVGF